jgi:hypothetical protein
MNATRPRPYSVLLYFVLALSFFGWDEIAAHDQGRPNLPSTPLDGSSVGTLQDNSPKSSNSRETFKSIAGTLSSRVCSDDRTPTRKISDRIPNIALHTHYNQPVCFYEDLVKDRTVIINFMYTTCGDI